MHRFRTIVLTLFLLVSFVPAVFAVNPDEVLDDPELEARARALSIEIRCLVCQNQSIDDSDAQLARDLRVLVREKLVEGLTDEEILEFLVERYGEFVLLKPRFGGQTIILWGLPIVTLLIGGWAASRMFKRPGKKDKNITPLTEDEKTAISKILKE